jgi:uncharacterized spore protein YtfJ
MKKTETSTTKVPALQETVVQALRTLHDEARVHTVFGDPVELGDHTMMPVARVEIQGGGGGGMGSRQGVLEGARALASRLVPFGQKFGWGGGGGGGVHIVIEPVGFVRDGGDGPSFFPIVTSNGQRHG